jgi:hypothetical protein
MSPDLERLLQALYENRTCPPEEKAHRNATLERLLQDAARHHQSAAGGGGAFVDGHLQFPGQPTYCTSVCWPLPERCTMPP